MCVYSTWNTCYHAHVFLNRWALSYTFDVHTLSCYVVTGRWHTWSCAGRSSEPHVCRIWGLVRSWRHVCTEMRWHVAGRHCVYVLHKTSAVSPALNTIVSALEYKSEHHGNRNIYNSWRNFCLQWGLDEVILIPHGRKIFDFALHKSPNHGQQGWGDGWAVRMNMTDYDKASRNTIMWRGLVGLPSQSPIHRTTNCHRISVHFIPLQRNGIFRWREPANWINSSSIIKNIWCPRRACLGSSLVFS